MAEFDARASARWLGPVEEPDPTAEALAQELAERIGRLAEELRLFAEPEWPALERRLRAETNTLIASLVEGHLEGIAQAEFLRGQIAALRRVLRLPETLRAEMSSARQELDALEGVEREDIQE